MLLPAVAVGQPVRGPIHNEDETDFFWRAPLPDGKAGEAIDRYIDVMAEAGIKTLLCNTNARRTNYRSRVWEAYWDGYDAAGPDHQAFLAAIPREEVASFRSGVNNMLGVHRQGIDYPARVIGRCRLRGISPWISLRMNDCHYNDVPDHPFHGTFWKKNPEFRRKQVSGYFATCLDYAHPEVRAYFQALIAESLDRYDIDGLELDFMREPFLFSAGQEAEGAVVLTRWLRDIRKLAQDAAEKRKHPVYLGVRVPSRPEVAAAWGLDAVAWAREGLIDLLVATPRWATIEFDLPLREWRERLGPAKVTLAGGLEVRYQPCPGGPGSLVTPEQAAGAAVAVLAQGADAVYLFNYFQNSMPWPRPIYLNTLKAMGSLETLQALPRCVGITYRDITGPNERYQPPLPATGRELAFTLNVGPVSDRERPCEVRVGVAPSPDPAAKEPTAEVNGQGCTLLGETTEEGLRVISFKVPPAAIPLDGACTLRVRSGDPRLLTVHRVEIALARRGA